MDTGHTYIASWWLPTEFGEILVSFIQDSMLLLDAHLHGVLMRVAVKASEIVRIQHHIPLRASRMAPLHFMPSVSYHGAFFRKSLEGVTGDEPGGLDIIFCE